MTVGYWDAIDLADERIAHGFELLRARRAADPGARVGWKVGMNDGGIRSMLGIASGVIGYLSSTTVLTDGVVPLGTGTLGCEVEVAFTVGADGGLARAGAALELVDLHELDVTDALARDVWHHGLVLGPSVPWSASMLSSLRVSLSHGDVDIDVAAPGDDKLADLDGMLAFVRSGAAALGDSLQPGDVIISGSLAPSILWLQPGDVVSATIEPLGSVSATVAQRS